MRRWFCLLGCSILAACDGSAVVDTDAGPRADGGRPPSSVHIVAAEGGLVGSEDGIFVLLVPPDALAQDTDISISTVPRAEWSAEVAATDPIGEVYDIQPDGLAFLQPAYAIHRWPSLPPELDVGGGEIALGVHYARSADGTIETTETTTRIHADRALVAGTIEHLSQHWLSGAIDGTAILAVVGGAGGSHPVGMPWYVMPQLVRSGRNLPSVDLRAGTFVNQAAGGPVAVLEPPGGERSGALTALDFYDIGNTTESLTALSPTRTTALDAVGFNVYDPAPGWRCERASGDTTSTIGVIVEVTVGGRGLSLEADIEPAVACTEAATGPRILTTTAQPDGFSLFQIGGAPSEVPQLALDGLPDGVWAAILGEDGLDLVHLGTGERHTNEFVPAGYGVVAYRAPTYTAFASFGPEGWAQTGWSDGDFGITQLGGGVSNYTDIAAADFDGDGTSEHLVFTNNGGGSFFVDHLDGTGNSLFGFDPRFPGGTISALPVGAEIGVTGDDLVIVLVNGEVLYGPYRGEGSFVSVGFAGTDPRLFDCVGTTTKVCAIAGYGDDTIYMLEIDGTGARLTASHAVGDAPIEPGLRDNGGLIDVLVAGSGDNTIEVLRYDTDTDTLSSLLPRATVDGCLEPGHAEWAGANVAVINCRGSDAIAVLPLDIP